MFARSLASRTAAACSLLAFATASVPNNPIKVAGTSWVAGAQTSTNIPYVIRDGGWQGTIGGVTVQVYADSLTCPNEQDYESGNNCNSGFVGNSIVMNTFAPNEVMDYGSGAPALFCSGDGDGNSIPDSRLHLGNLVPTGSDSGAIWYVDLIPPGTNGCTEIDGCPIKSGVASVKASSGGQIPSCSAQPGFWDVTSEPMFGTASAIGPLEDGYVYLTGQLDGQVPGSSYNDVYLARVGNTNELDYSSYEYWNGNEFTSTRLTYPNYNGWSPASIITGVSAFGSMYYNAFYNQYVVLAVNTTVGNEILAYTASLPQGPWTDPITLYQNSSFGGPFTSLYSPQALPSYDTSGKSLTFAVSLFGRNSVSGVIKVDFE